MAQITKVNTPVTFTKSQVKNAAALGADLTEVNESFAKVNIPSILQEKMNAEIAQVIASHLAKLEPLRGDIDALLGDGAFDQIQSQHTVKVSVWGAKLQAKMARIRLAERGVIPAGILEVAETATDSDDAESLGFDLEL